MRCTCLLLTQSGHCECQIAVRVCSSCRAADSAAVHLVLLRLYRLKQPIEGPFGGLCRTIEGPCYRRFVFLRFTRRWFCGIGSAHVFGAPSTHRPGRLLFQSIQIGGDSGGRLRAGRVVLPEEALEPENLCGRGHTLGRFMTARTIGRVKLGVSWLSPNFPAHRLNLQCRP
jgi:hypothetical protein